MFLRSVSALGRWSPPSLAAMISLRAVSLRDQLAAGCSTA